MLGMAFLTFFFLLDATVETALFGNIFADLFVAICAQTGLCGFIEFFVTLFAIFFFLGVTFNHIAGRNHATECLMINWHGKAKKQKGSEYFWH
jgi:hypothetical protein